MMVLYHLGYVGDSVQIQETQDWKEKQPEARLTWMAIPALKLMPPSPAIFN